jgi:hypothetical protein
LLARAYANNSKGVPRVASIASVARCFFLACRPGLVSRIENEYP